LSSESVWETAPLPANVRVERDLYFERRRQTFRRFNSKRDPALVIVDRVQIYTWTTFSLEPDTELTIGDDCVLVGATFMCAGRTSVGNRVVISLNAAPTATSTRWTPNCAAGTQSPTRRRGIPRVAHPSSRGQSRSATT